jgi:hypothetical protein
MDSTFGRESEQTFSQNFQIADDFVRLSDPESWGFGAVSACGQGE